MAAMQEYVQKAEAVAEEFLNKYDLNSAYDHDVVAEVLSALAEKDLLRFGFSDSDVTGPQKGDMAKAYAVISTLAGKSGVLANIYMVGGLLAPLCVAYQGTKAQKADILTKVAEGKMQLAFALTEPDAGSDAAAAKTTATPDGDGYVLNGEKVYITGAATADIILAVAKTNPENPKSFGVFMIPKGTAGVTVEPLARMTGGEIHPSCHITLENVHLAKTQVLGGEEALEKAWGTFRKTGMLERLVVSFMATGLAKAMTERASQFITERKQFGKPLKSFQSIQHTVVEMATLTKGMELFAENALHEQENNPNPTQAISMAKYFNAEQLQKVAAMAVRVMGGRAYFDFEPVSHYYREAPFSLFAGGTVEVQKMLIARSMGI